MPYIVALSGGIASGKTTVTNLFAQLGVPIVDADIIAREVVAKDSFALKQIAQHFGQQILLPNGDLDRTQLRNIIFNNEQDRLWLNNCLHPLIAQVTQQKIAQYHHPYIIWAVPLLIENNLDKLADRVLIIDTHHDIQLARLQKRDNISKELAKNMLLSQISNDKRISYADDIIINNGQESPLLSQIEQLHNKYLHLANTTNQE